MTNFKKEKKRSQERGKILKCNENTLPQTEKGQKIPPGDQIYLRKL